MPASQAVTVRRAQAADAETLTPLFEAYRRFFTGAADDAGSQRFLRERLEAGDSAVFAAFVNGVATGFTQLYPLFSSWYARHQWFLSDLYVRDTYRTRGIGKQLIRYAVDFARAGGSRAILVELPFSQPHLAAFYGGFGFRRDTVFELYRLTLE